MIPTITIIATILTIAIPAPRKRGRHVPEDIITKPDYLRLGNWLTTKFTLQF